MSPAFEEMGLHLSSSKGQSTEQRPAEKLWGTFTKKERWGLSRRGWTTFLLGLVVAAVVVIFGAQPFLAVTRPASTDILVVEGWLPTFCLQEVAAECKNHAYRHVLVVRPILSFGDKYDSGRYSGDYVATSLVECGVPNESVSTLFCRASDRDRTYHTALAARHWFATNGVDVKALNVATLGPHARRSRMLFQKAFGDDVNVGVIALEDKGYEAAHWWRYSRGVQEIGGEGLAYLYARIVFHPSIPPDKEPL